jgi:WH1 domain
VSAAQAQVFYFENVSWFLGVVVLCLLSKSASDASLVTQNAWAPQGGGAICTITLYKHNGNGSHRIIGMTPERACNINSAVREGFTWTRASQIFGQFKDPQHQYGLNFKSAPEAESFAQYVRAPALVFPFPFALCEQCSHPI